MVLHGRAAALALAVLVGAGAPAVGSAQAAPPVEVEPVPPPLPPGHAPVVPPAPPVPEGAPGDAGPRPRPVPEGGLLPGELPPPSAIAARPASPGPGVERRTSVTLNFLALSTGVFTGSTGTWRAEVAIERALKARVGAAGYLAVGQVLDDERDDAWVAELAGQYRWYFRGRFDRGLYLAGTLGFWSIDPYVAWSLGGGVGLKHTLQGGLTVDLQLGLQLPVEWFRHDDGGNPPALRDAWEALLPGLVVGVGWSLDEGFAGRGVRPRSVPR